MFSLKKRVALIAGPTDEVGQAISSDLARKGSKLLLADFDSGKLEALAQKLRSEGNQVEMAVISQDDPATFKAAVDLTVQKFGALDILINNIDSDQGVSISEARPEDWEDSLKENVNPVVLFCLSAVPKMREKKYGRIVNVGSWLYLGFPNRANYSASKAALFGMTRAFALELAKDNITANLVLKGDIEKDESISEEDRTKIAKGIPVQRLGKADDVAYAVSYLASDEAKYVTGQTLFVCGGRSLYSSMSV